MRRMHARMRTQPHTRARTRRADFPGVEQRGRCCPRTAARGLVASPTYVLLPPLNTVVMCVYACVRVRACRMACACA